MESYHVLRNLYIKEQDNKCVCVSRLISVVSMTAVIVTKVIACLFLFYYMLYVLGVLSVYY